MPSSKFYQTDAVIEDVIEVIKLGKDVVSALLETWHLVEQTNVGGGVELPFPKGKQRKILNSINEVSRKINMFEDDVCVTPMAFYFNFVAIARFHCSPFSIRLCIFK